MNVPSLSSQKLNFNLAGVNISPSYIQAGLVVLLLFILVLTLARMRRYFLNWSLKGSLFGIFWGFVLALILEGFLILGGRTVITEIIGWEDAPKPIVNALDAGKSKLVEVLGITDQIPSSYAENEKAADDLLDLFRKLDVSEAEEVREVICEP